LLCPADHGWRQLIAALRPKYAPNTGPIDEIAISLTTRSLTTGEISKHERLEETVSWITDKVIDDLSDWANRLLDRIYPMIFVDVIAVSRRPAPSFG
jgi:transposase-like protein